MKGNGRTRMAPSQCILYFALILVIILQTTRSISALSTRKYPSHFKTTTASSVAKTERREKERSLVAREVCERCNRPPVLCVCKSLPQKLIATSTTVLILQHPREFRRKALSTVPLIPLVLQNCTIKVGYNFSPENLDLIQNFLQQGQKPLLLFPGPNVTNLDSTEKDFNEFNGIKRLKEKGQLLILIDGTWAEAKRMIIQSPNLVQVCEQVQFSADNKSIYDSVRKEPERHCISTLEACAHALMLLEPRAECAIDAKNFLEESMREMIETKMQTSLSRNPEPRFTRPNAKIHAKNKRRSEIKKELFGEK